MAVLDVKSPAGTYPIIIQPGLLSMLRDFVQDDSALNSLVVITNSTVAGLYAETVRRSLPEVSFITIPDGEVYKTLSTVEKIYTQMIRAGVDRSGIVLALGGGVIGDTAGFAAATYMRGIKLMQIPTTLLAMVDSSVGGKVGVDLPQGKNLVGAFKQPERVLIDPNVLRTLPIRELRCGMAEVLKHGFIADEHLLLSVVRMFERQNQTDEFFDDLAAMLPSAIQVKIQVVEQDPYEVNIRAYLNFGHTFAHAIEQVSGYRWLHGEAVGVGMAAEARLSRRIGLCDDVLVSIVEDSIRKVGLPTSLGDMDAEAVYSAMTTDKKWKSGRSRFVLLEAVGKPRIIDDVPVDDVMAILQGMRK